MSSRSKSAKLTQGRELASHLFDRKLKELVAIDEPERNRYLADYPMLSPAEFDDVVQQVIQAKRTEQDMVGWRVVPHDLTVIVLVGFTAVAGLQVGVVAAIGTLVLLESVFQVFFRSDWYRWLSLVSWLTYPAYAFFAYLLWREGLSTVWIIAGVAAAWVGPYLLGILARVPMRLWLDAKTKSKPLHPSAP